MNKYMHALYHKLRINERAQALQRKKTGIEGDWTES